MRDLGRQIGLRYHDTGFVTEPGQMYVQSTAVNRTQDSVYAFLAGYFDWDVPVLYLADGQVEARGMDPVVVHMKEKDYLLMSHSSSTCPAMGPLKAA